MARKQDWKPLLDAFKPDESRPIRRSKRFGPTWTIPKDIALPSLAELLRIDAAAEHAVAAATIKQDASKATGATSER